MLRVAMGPAAAAREPVLAVQRALAELLAEVAVQPAGTAGVAALARVVARVVGVHLQTAQRSQPASQTDRYTNARGV